jgi:hypothetical protein
MTARWVEAVEAKTTQGEKKLLGGPYLGWKEEVQTLLGNPAEGHPTCETVKGSLRKKVKRFSEGR